MLQGDMNETLQMPPGILPSQALLALISRGVIQSEASLDPRQVQPASLDLRLSKTAYRLRASFLPGRRRTVSECLSSRAAPLVMHEIDLSAGAVLETGCVYLVPLMEHLALPTDMEGRANPKSSTGRLDVFTRVITDKAERFDTADAGYCGPLYVEIAPRTFSVLARTGDTLVQLRLRMGKDAGPLRSQTVSIDLKGNGKKTAPIGWRARRHAGLVDLSKIKGHKAADYWQPVYAPNQHIILDPGEFYILASKEAVKIPEGSAAEMAPIATEIGEFRAHYAGFFDPGFGLAAAGGAGARAVLEVRGHDVPFLLRHGQPVARLDFEPMSAVPQALYGGRGSHYQAQGLRLSKHFSQ